MFLPLVILGGAAYFIGQALVQAQVGYHHLGEFLQKKEQLRGRAVQISGNVLPGSIRKDIDLTREDFLFR